MEINQELEYRIKYGLSKKAEEIKPTDDLLDRIINHIQNNEMDRQHESRNNISKWSVLKSMAILASVFIVSVVILFTFSKSTRVFAEQAFNGIKTIFVVDITNEGYNVIEKPISETPIITSSGKDTNLSDVDLSKKLGYNVSLPIRLCKGYYLLEKSEGVVLYKPIDYDIAQSLHDLSAKAVDDVGIFESLKKYEPVRFISGYYGSGEAEIAINIVKHKMEAYNSNIKVKKTKVDNINAFWAEFPFAEYPFVTIGKGNDSIRSMDMTQKPNSVFMTHNLQWYSNGIEYTISQMNKTDLSMKETVNLAKLFMKEQK